uniref:chromosomal protein D1-like isoform X1 n=1 Tax=Oncorhynchus gorbuscha TaxID=8017 RepID=UPI001EAF883E|nr:chromosomal protein D1-like isoform X1 [Oncorhynchus gorbuscha]XP_046182905.1 chromosomal protein D1-like isoform X2 [Oncorhynchus gorbuscha]XP_046182906.1 chromosomal protein D1-like isoform X1 [Oncorhynchus gorbuscha]XP_046182907.1 chromosomal protein D1-like isoform X1 [Oncorhynchus gorbuscha]XP_046182908.1 chromosomal protein D1-like isoform X2 [Oncorhynchus gorbuscha]
MKKEATMSEEGATMSEEGATMLDEGATASEEGEGATASEEGEGATALEEGATALEEGATALEEGATALEEGATASEEGATALEEGAMASEEGAMDATGSEEESDEALSNGSSIPPNRGRGRPKGSGSKKPKILRVLDKQPRGRPRKVVDPNAVSAETTAPLKRGRPKKVQQKKKMGRPRKYRLSPEEEEEREILKSQPKGPRVWKPLGRPRIHPRMDPPATPTSAEPRRRGRPLKVSTGRGAHLRKNPPPTSKVSKPPAKDDSPRKSGRPLGSFNAKRAAETDGSNSSPSAKQGCTVSPIVRLYRCSNGKANVFDEAAFQAQRQKGRRKTVNVDYTGGK